MMHFQEAEARPLAQELAAPCTASSCLGSLACFSPQHCHVLGLTDSAIPGASVLLVLVPPAGHCGCQEVTRSRGTRDVAFGWTQGGHGSAHTGWERGRGDRGAGGGHGACELLVRVPAVAMKPVGNSGGGDGSRSNVAVRMTELTLRPTDGFWGRFVVVLWAGGERHLPFLSFYN